MSVELLSELLVRQRKALGLTQEDLALLLGVSQQAYGKWESGVGTPRPQYMAKVAEVLHLSIEEAVRAQVAQKEAIRVRLSEDASVAPSNTEAKGPVGHQVLKERGIVGLTGFGLMTMLSTALEKQRLQQHQIETLSSLVDSFVRASAEMA